MNTFENWSEVFSASMHNLWLQLVAAVPIILAGLGLLLLGWLIARSARWLSYKFLKTIRFNQMLERFNLQDVLNKARVDASPARIVSKAIFWTIILIFFVGFAEILGWQIVSEKIAGIIAFIPRLFAGLVILAVGFYIASFVRRVIEAGGSSLGLSSAKILGTIAQYVLFVIIVLTTLEQIGVNIDLIKSNVIILIGGVILAFGIGYGIGSRHMVANILAAFYGKRKFHPGQYIRIDGVEGKIEIFDSHSLVLRTKNNRLVVIPAARLAEQTVEILPLPPKEGKRKDE